MIDLEKAKSEFERYTGNYDMENWRIVGKHDHSLRVMDYCGEIAEKKGLNEEDILLAKLIGLIHDIARFDQWTQYETFEDMKSFDHGERAVLILEDNDYLRWYIDTDEYDYIIKAAIRNHNKYEMESGLDERQKLFSRIVRDADRVDILNEYVGFFLPDDKDVEKVNNSYVSKEVFKQIEEKKMVNSINSETPLDEVVRALGFIYDINFKETKDIIEKNQFYSKILDRFDFKMENTRREMDVIKNNVFKEINSKWSEK